MQLDLLGQILSVPEVTSNELLGDIPELTYKDNYIDQTIHDSLINSIDAQPWMTDLKRKVQHYGYKYDYKARRIDKGMLLGELPLWLQPLAHRLYQDGYMPAVPDQVIVNEYEPGQGIASHIDCEPCFGNVIISLSLGSGCIMNFTHKLERKQLPVWLATRSIVVLQGTARYDWLHGIAARKSDEINGRKIERRRRVSLTFRKVIL